METNNIIQDVQQTNININTSTTLYIDSREGKLIEYLINRNIQFLQKQLELGDVIIQSNNPSSAFNIIIERKTYADLASSIKDGRYKEQKTRLLASYPAYHCMYILEGDKSDINKTLMNQSILDGVIYHTMFRDRMHVMFSSSVKETADIVLAIFNKCLKNPEKFVATGENTNYVANLKIKKCKMENIDKETCYILQLCQIPNISHVIAKEIAKRYRNWKELVEAIESYDTLKEKIEIFTAIPMIGDKKAKQIIEYLQ